MTNADWLISPPAAQILPGLLRERVRMAKIKETERVRIPSVPAFFVSRVTRACEKHFPPVISGESGRRPPPRRFAPRGRTSPYSPEMTGGTYISHTFLQASKFERKANRNEVFIATRDSRRLHIIPFSFILPESGKQDASLRHRRYAGEAKLQLSWLWNPLSIPLGRKSTRIQAQLHTLALGVEVDLGLASPVLPNRTPCLPSQQTARGRPRIKLRSRSTTWQLVVLVPRSTDTHVAKHMAISRNVWAFSFSVSCWSFTV